MRLATMAQSAGGITKDQDAIRLLFLEYFLAALKDHTDLPANRSALISKVVILACEFPAPQRRDRSGYGQSFVQCEPEHGRTADQVFDNQRQADDFRTSVPRTVIIFIAEVLLYVGLAGFRSKDCAWSSSRT